MKLDADKTVREIAIEHPCSVRVFESLGIDYCCGGKRTLRDACERANISLEQVLKSLAANGNQAPQPVGNWAHASVLALTQHIVQQHHAYVRRESPRLIGMLEKVVAKHGSSHQELGSVRDLFVAMAEELFAHMAKEENVLFPYLVKMEEAVNQNRVAPPAVFGSVELPISRMLADHDDAGELTARIRGLSADFRAPENACPTYRALYQGLEEFERDLHQHVHLENNILFPHALEMERKERSYVS